MDWKKDAVTKLEQYVYKKSALKNIPLQIAEIESDMASMRGATPSTITINSSVRVRDDVALNAIIRKKNLESNLIQTEKWLEYMDAALELLSQEEYRILERFYFTSQRGAAEELAIELRVDIKTVYHRKDRALRRFTMALYGLCET